MTGWEDPGLSSSTWPTPARYDAIQRWSTATGSGLDRTVDGPSVTATRLIPIDPKKWILLLFLKPFTGT